MLNSPCIIIRKSTIIYRAHSCKHGSLEAPWIFYFESKPFELLYFLWALIIYLSVWPQKSHKKESLKKQLSFWNLWNIVESESQEQHSVIFVAHYSLRLSIFKKGLRNNITWVATSWRWTPYVEWFKGLKENWVSRSTGLQLSEISNWEGVFSWSYLTCCDSSPTSYCTHLFVLKHGQSFLKSGKFNIQLLFSSLSGWILFSSGWLQT